MDLIKVGDWVLNTQDICAAHYVETPDGPTVEVYTRSGGEPYRQKGGFTASGEEARRLWAWFVAQSRDVLAPATRNGKAPAGLSTGGNGL